jgi:sterol desaturase/sphingolipid hydroxylase (fatty acid hydroxylase superfamily)
MSGGKQGTAFKYNRQWPKESRPFCSGNQTYDNMFYTLVSGVPIWTAYELSAALAYANSIAPMINLAENLVLVCSIFFLVPFIHEVGFYCAHRLLHWPPLYEVAHKLHHRNTNPGPWSGLSMHPIEHVIYFSPILLFFSSIASRPHDQSRLAPWPRSGPGAHGI